MSNLEILLKIITPLAILILCLILGLILEKNLKRLFNKMRQSSHLQSYLVILESFKGMLPIWLFLVGVALTLPIIPLHLHQTLRSLIEKILITIFLLSITFVVSRLSVSFIRIYSSKHESTVPLTSLFEYLTKVLIFTIGFLVIIQSLGIQITALITAFGVGGLSIGLAFQNTLTNLISGVNIIIARKIRPGDYIKIKDGQEGYVVDVELKYTIIKAITDHLIVVPNSLLINSIFKNYSMPDQSLILPIKVGIDYDSDLEKVEIVTLKVAKKIMETVEGGIPEYEPFMRYEKFDYFAINFTVYLKIREYYYNLIITHEFIKQLSQAYQQEGIKMPFPLSNSYYFQNKLD